MQQKIASDNLLIKENSHVRRLILVHEGEVAAVNIKLDRTGKRKFYSLGKNSIPGFSSLIRDNPSPVTYVTTAPSVISFYPVSGNFSNIILGKVNIGLTAVHSLHKEVLQSFQMVQKTTTLSAYIQKITDNIALSYQYLEVRKNRNQDLIDPVAMSAKVTQIEFEKNGGMIPRPITSVWLQTDHSSILKKNYQFEPRFNHLDLQLVRKILALPIDIQNTVYHKDLGILEGIGEQLRKILHQNIQELSILQAAIDMSLELLLGKIDSFANNIASLPKSSSSVSDPIKDQESRTIASFLSQNSKTILHYYQTLQGIPYAGDLETLDKIEAKNLTSTSQAGIDVDSLKKNNLKNSVQQILSFAKTRPEVTRDTMEAFNQINLSQIPWDTDAQQNKSKRKIISVYWEAYQNCLLLHKQYKGKVPDSVKLMLRFGFFDEKLIDDSQIHFLYNHLEDKSSSQNNLLDSVEWLDQIYDSKQVPSVSNLGQTYIEQIKAEKGKGAWKRESDIPEEINTPECRIRYEIKNFLMENVRITSGSPTKSFPILNRYNLSLPIEKCFVSKSLIERKIQEILSVDTFAFHREILLNDEIRKIEKEFVQMSILPLFVIVPSVGTKIMMWQEISGFNKTSPARIAVPVFATMDLFTMLIEVVAILRWEITKTMMGVDWNNVTRSSLTTDYTDYLLFYKKSRDISGEVKQKIAADLKRFRNDRDRFASDYTKWIKYESQGILRMNKLVRAIFFRHIPFNKPIREQIANHPAYTEHLRRFTNLRKRKLRELEIRYRKYGENLPIELKKNLEFYSI